MEERRGEDERKRAREGGGGGNRISFIKFGFKNHNETPRHVDKKHNASIPPSFHWSLVLNDAMLESNSPYFAFFPFLFLSLFLCVSLSLTFYTKLILKEQT